jgi:putative transposase
MRYAWIKQHRDSFSVSSMCRTLDVSTSGYYRWLKAGPSLKAQRSARIRTSIQQVYDESHGIYGSYRIADRLRDDDSLEAACRNTVATARREMGLKSKVSKKFSPTTTVSDATKTAAPNVLNQSFKANAPNRKWVTDITYLPTAAGWVYLAVVLDLFSRKVAGWAISESLATPLVSSALRNAVELRKPDTNGLLHHSDRGSQYTSDDYQQTLRTLNMTCSMSRTGCCYDNAVMERFFWSLKHEWTKFQTFDDIIQARLSVFQYIETFYNSKRIHQTLGYRTPDEFEELHQAKPAV